MGNRRRNLWIVVVLALLGGFAWVVLRPHEPVFEGQPLSLVLHAADTNRALRVVSYSGAYPPESEIPRMRAERALRSLGTDALPILVEMAGTWNSGFREFVGEMAGDPAMAFLHLPPQEDKHEIAAWGMKLLGDEARPAVPALIRLLGDKNPSARAAAAQCLAAIGPAAAAAVPALVRMLENNSQAKHYEGGVVYWAARALGEIGPAASAAVPSLARMTNEAAAVALIEINQGSFQLFFERLKDTSDVGKWCGTAEEVGRLGANADPAIPLLLAGFQHTNDRILSLAARTVGKLHRRPDLCLGPLVSLLNSTNSHLRRHVLVALGAFGPAAKPVAPEIARWLNDRDPWVRTEATNALRLIDLEGPGVKGKRL